MESKFSVVATFCLCTSLISHFRTHKKQKHAYLLLFWLAGFVYTNMLVLCWYLVTASKCPGLYINNKCMEYAPKDYIIYIHTVIFLSWSSTRTRVKVAIYSILNLLL